ncbi:MAG: methyltransferase, partial [bacterium]|nr:methyltransferase [bacterium]
KTAESFDWQGINTGESVALCPQNVSLNMKNILGGVLNRDIKEIRESADFTTELSELLFRMMQGQLQAVGLFAEKRQRTETVKRKTGIIDLYDRWLEQSLAVFSEKGLIEYDGESYTARDISPVDTDALWKEWERKKNAWSENPGMRARAELVEATLHSLPEILTGKIPATDIMFPNSSVELVQGVYKNNDLADYFNNVVADTVSAYIKERLKENLKAEIRIFEIGAGTGSTSEVIFEKLRPYKESICEYCYTDISKAFLMHAEEEYGKENPYLTYKIFDVEKPVEEQGADTAGYDMVIAANVLHATRDIRQTIRNAKAVIKKNGLILLSELSANSLFLHLTFGLLKGWWLFEDPELRIPGCPGLAPGTWKQTLRQEGFTNISFPAEQAHDFGQQIIVAESDGFIRQRKSRIHTTELARVSLNSSIERVPRRLQRGLASESEILIPGEKITDDLLREKSAAYIKKLIGEVLKIPVQRIDSATSFEKYGLDSILVVQLSNKLRNVFKNITTTLFFEYQTVDELITHFIKAEKKSLVKLTGLAESHGTGDDAVTAGSLPVSPRLQSRHIRRFYSLKNDKEKDRDIAITGLSGSYPQAESTTEFWNNLKEGKNCITEIPKERWDWKKYFDQEKGKKGRIYTKWGGFIDDVDKFDPLFFNISPREAEMMDPQERLFLKAAYACIEDAGYTPPTLCKNGKVGVFVGVMNSNYPSGAQHWSIANRVSYLLNFHGPSIALDTACSSSLTAIHSAMESLYSGASECAIAGGVNLITDPVQYLRLSSMQMLASDNRNKSFGAGADGFIDSEGVGAILLKPLQKAVEDGDHIYGIIKAGSINAGGKTSGYTVPNPNAQFELIAEALKSSGINPRTISYIEAHGTGTSLGDPIEIAGLTKAFEEYTEDKQFCAIGSVKSNIGHSESAAGIAGVTKILLQLKYGLLVPSLHSGELNPGISFTNTPFTVQQKLSEWKRPVVEVDGGIKEYPRRAGISSFGAGGANAHVIIEEHKEQPAASYSQIPDLRPDLRPLPTIFVLSAKSEECLKAYAERMADFLENAVSSQPVIGTDEEFLSENLKKDLLSSACDILNVKESDFDYEGSLAEHGCEPVSLAEFCKRVNEKYELK